MNAGKKFLKKTEAQYEVASDKMMKLWVQRHPSYQTFTTHYMASQRRILFLADIDPDKRFENFETLCFKRQLAPTTAETYWTTWLGVQKALNIKPCDADARTTKLTQSSSQHQPRCKRWNCSFELSEHSYLRCPQS